MGFETEFTDEGINAILTSVRKSRQSRTIA